ncbi:hypothetical protein X805_23980 [Sphaerotilus natans subsp. natans DSM 6575]|uniref:Uncharacterized protein n=1 Tax=Sphaerotilus natans subsp. natans DSM 6575 TaxID=1286631 RepID=A0A059KLS6_9BURK|nr:hypothetical protein X805_23980 [Sphaerotilus natans subsp. natans DSM 6575]
MITQRQGSPEADLISSIGASPCMLFVAITPPASIDAISSAASD